MNGKILKKFAIKRSLSAKSIVLPTKSSVLRANGTKVLQFFEDQFRKCENREINDQNRFLKPVSSADNAIVGILRQIEGRFAKCDRRFDDEVSDEGASFRASNLRQMCF